VAIIDLVTPKVAATDLLGGFLEHLSWAYVAQQSVTKIKYVFIDLVTLNARAKHEPLFN
jgi:hypothetical protein